MARRPRRQTVSMGGFTAVKIGGPWLGDLYYRTMEMSWPVFIGLVAAVFLAINTVFGLLYASLPGIILNAVPGSVADGFFFSVETLATVGYGNMAPATHLGHAIAVVEILLGLFFTATMTGLIFARFARPRDSLIFSNVAVIAPYQNTRALMVRLASTRGQAIADASAQMSWLESVELADGRIFRRLVDLPLIRSRNPMLGLAWTLVHLIEPDSPLLAALAGTDRFMLTVTVNGIDTLLANQSVGGRSYRREEVLVDHRFIDVMTDQEGIMHLDLGLIHHTEAIVL